MKKDVALIDKIRPIVFLFVSIIIVLGVLLASSCVSADDSVIDQINITVPVSCTITGTGMNTHNANINNGLYEDDIGSTTLHAFCNDNEGFAIYAAGYTGNEVGGTNSNKLVGTTASNNATIESGTATTAGNPDISNWAMKLAISQDSGDTTGTNAFTIDSAPNVLNGADASFSSYHTVPNEYTKVAHKDSNTDMTTNTGGVKLTTTYAAYISKTQPADTYSGQVIYTLVHPVSAAAPVFLNPNADDISEVTYMQQFAVVGDANKQAIIDSMIPEQQYTLLDSRDGKSYTIAKYQVKYYDANTDSEETVYDVWMTKNLDLDLDSTRTYTNDDTDLGYNYVNDEYDIAAWTPSTSTEQSGVVWNFSNTFPKSYDPGDLYWNETTDAETNDWNMYYNSCTYNYDTMVYEDCDDSLNPISAYTSSTGLAQYHLGNYYNWSAAIADNSADTYEGGSTMQQSICPSGWTLPHPGEGRGTFYSLWKEYGLSTYSSNETYSLWSSPLYFVASGYMGTPALFIGTGGNFWTAGEYSNTGARYGNYYIGGRSYPLNNDFTRSSGYSVRCVARPVGGF